MQCSLGFSWRPKLPCNVIVFSHSRPHVKETRLNHQVEWRSSTWWTDRDCNLWVTMRQRSPRGHMAAGHVTNTFIGVVHCHWHAIIPSSATTRSDCTASAFFPRGSESNVTQLDFFKSLNAIASPLRISAFIFTLPMNEHRNVIQYECCLSHLYLSSACCWCTYSNIMQAKQSAKTMLSY